MTPCDKQPCLSVISNHAPDRVCTIKAIPKCCAVYRSGVIYIYCMIPLYVIHDLWFNQESCITGMQFIILKATLARSLFKHHLCFSKVIWQRILSIAASTWSGDLEMSADLRLQLGKFRGFLPEAASKFRVTGSGVSRNPMAITDRCATPPYSSERPRKRSSTDSSHNYTDVELSNIKCSSSFWNLIEFRKHSE